MLATTPPPLPTAPVREAMRAPSLNPTEGTRKPPSATLARPASLTPGL